MTRCVALLRAVNLGSHNKVSMSQLRTVAGRLGLEDAQTIVQSGNLVFADPRERTPPSWNSCSRPRSPGSVA